MQSGLESEDSAFGSTVAGQPVQIDANGVVSTRKIKGTNKLSTRDTKTNVSMTVKGGVSQAPALVRPTPLAPSPEKPGEAREKSLDVVFHNSPPRLLRDPRGGRAHRPPEGTYPVRGHKDRIVATMPPVPEPGTA